MRLNGLLRFFLSLLMCMIITKFFCSFAATLNWSLRYDLTIVDTFTTRQTEVFCFMKIARVSRIYYSLLKRIVECPVHLNCRWCWWWWLQHQQSLSSQLILIKQMSQLSFLVHRASEDKIARLMRWNCNFIKFLSFLLLLPEKVLELEKVLHLTTVKEKRNFADCFGLENPISRLFHFYLWSVWWFDHVIKESH